jgi:hypothetical protein
MKKNFFSKPLHMDQVPDLGNIPPYKKIPFPFGELEDFSLRINSQNRFGDYQKAIVIGLGKTGEIILRQWLHELSLDLSRLDNNSPPIRACVINRFEEPSEFPFRYLRLTEINQVNPGDRNVQKKFVRSLFIQDHNLNSFRTWLQGCLYDLSEGEEGIRVVFVGSLGDPMIGVLGELLHVLNKTANGNAFQSVVALLAIQSPPDMAMSTSESYAVLREISRLSVGGTHFVEDLPSLPGNFIKSSMLDQIFLIGTENNPIDYSGSPEATFELGSAQVLSQVLLSLLHPASRLVWDHLHNLSHSGNKVVHTISVASLTMPARKMEAYFSARLVIAAIFGERTDKLEEGVLSRDTNAGRLSLAESASLVRGWFRNGPSPHSFFDLLLSNQINENRKAVLSISNPEGFLPAFQTQLGNGLTSFLNQDNRGDLQIARDGVSWLYDYLTSRQSDFASIAVNSPKFQNFLDRCLEIVRDMRKQLSEWGRVMEHPTAHQDDNKVVPLGWESPDAQKSVGKVALWQIFEEKKSIADEALLHSGQGNSRRAVTDLDDLDDFYEGTIRPELSQFGMESSSVFLRVRERLAWYVRLVPGESPKLLFVCLPANVSKEAIPDNAYFWHTDVQKLADAIEQLAFEILHAKIINLAPNWFRDLLKKGDRLNFLRRANKPTLNYRNGSDKLIYLIAGDNVVIEENRRRIFPDTFYSVNPLLSGDAGVITALTIWTNIPLESINQIAEWKQSYQNNFHGLHPYPQEKNAVIYERLARSALGTSVMIDIPTSLSLSLVNSRRVTLFCQALFSGLISLQQGRNGSLMWATEPLGDFPRLDLAPGHKDKLLGLLEAFNNFTLNLSAESQTQTSLNPLSHFGGGHEDYMQLLLKTSREYRLKSDFPQCDSDLLAKIQHEWLFSDDEDNRAFAAIFAVELNEPVWKDWNR